MEEEIKSTLTENAQSGEENALSLKDEAEVKAETEASDENGSEEGTDIDYEMLAASDLKEIQMLSPDFADVRHLSELPFARRFAELREMGLSVKEALFATLPSLPRQGGKSHLQSSVPRAKGRGEDSLSTEEMRAAKDLFYGLSEKEINALYRRVSTR